MEALPKGVLAEPSPGDPRPAGPEAADVAGRLAEALEDVPRVVSVAVDSLGSAFRVTTVVDRFDLDVCQDVFRGEAALYQWFPELEAEFRVVGQDEAAARGATDSAEIVIEKSHKRH